MANRNWIQRASYAFVIRNQGREIEMTLYGQDIQDQASLPQSGGLELTGNRKYDQ